MTMIKSGLGLVGLVAMTALSFSGVARAEEEREFGYSLTLGATNDYIFRGLSFTSEDPAAQGSIDFSYGKLYLGFWGSNVDGDGFSPAELDIYAGYKPTWGQFNFDFGVIGYLYPLADDSLEYVEFKAGVSTEIVKNLTGGAIFYYTPETDNYGETYTVEGSLAYVLPEVGIFTPTVSGGVGYTEETGDNGLFSNVTDNYVYWNAGLALGVEKWIFDFRYWDTDLDSVPGDVYTGLSEERFVFTAKITLP